MEPPFDGEIAKNLHLDRLISWGCDQNLLFAVLAHHGRPFQVQGRAAKGWRAVPAANYDPLTASVEIGALLPDWFAGAFEEDGDPLPTSPHFQHLFCGLVSLADWLGSNRDIFEFVPQLERGYMAAARDKAQRAAQDIGLNTEKWRLAVAGRTSFESFAPGWAAKSTQQIVGDWSLDDPLTILEAETGSGKTEAALWRFAQLFEAGKVDSLYFALPTRAAAKQIHGRVDRALKHLFGEQAPEAVLAIPSYFKAGQAEGKAMPSFEVLWDDDPDERVRLARWAAENAKRHLAATVAVGTVDQAMLAALQVKHAHLRSAALSKSLLVIDEVHASDPYMTAVQDHLLRIHFHRGGHAMLMSATLGSSARSRWLKGRKATPPSFQEALEAPYPVVWGKSTPPRTPRGKDEDDKCVSMTLALSWSAQEACERAVSAAKRGARVLVIRNTVRSAIETFREVVAAGHANLLWQVAGGPALHHSRFAPEDRRLLDGEVEAALSPKPEIRSPRGMIVIGTQTLEQSLDIDADLLVTDLCPVDVLLQRIGRLHRHRLERPAGFAQPQCVVLSPEQGLDQLAAHQPENGLGKFRDGGGVYLNLHACELTRRLVLSSPEWLIPSMNRRLVESATHPEQFEALNQELGKTWQDYWSNVYGKDIADAQAAHSVLVPVDEPLIDEAGNPRLFASDEEKIRTRLGAEGAVVRLPEAVPGPFGQRITSLTLPPQWSMGVGPDSPIEIRVLEESLIAMVAERCFLYDREGLKRATRDGAGVQSAH